MAHNIYHLDASYWAVVDGNMQTNGMVSEITQAYIINPTSLNSSGFNKSKANMTREEFNAYFTTLTPGTTVVPNASDFTVSNWTSKGWGSTINEIKSGYNNFIENNFNGANKLQINAASRDLQTLLVSGRIGGVEYFLPLSIYGQQGTVASLATAPSAPTVTGSVGDTQVTLSWSAPNNGGSAITDYVVQYSSNSGSTWTTFADGTSTSTSVTVTGLTNGTAYIFRVAAVNDIAQGSYSNNTPSLTPSAATVPANPTGLTGSVGGNQVTLSWSAPNNGGSAITDYVVQYSSNSGSTWTTFSDGVSTSTSATVTGLTNGTAYIFRVAAVNALGQGSYSSNSSSYTPSSLGTWLGFENSGPPAAGKNGGPTVTAIPTFTYASATTTKVTVIYADDATGGTQMTKYGYWRLATDGMSWDLQVGATSRTAANNPSGSNTSPFELILPKGRRYRIWLTEESATGDYGTNKKRTQTMDFILA